MPNWKGIAGLTFTPEEFDGYCHSLRWDAWRPSFIVLHNTAVPSLAQRPSGFTRADIANLEAFYRDKQGWSAGPHLFVDDRQIWVFTRLTVSGIHSPSWNKLAFGVEMLGDYEREAFDQGRGPQSARPHGARHRHLVRGHRYRPGLVEAPSRRHPDHARLSREQSGQGRHDQGNPGRHRVATWRRSRPARRTDSRRSR